MPFSIKLYEQNPYLNKFNAVIKNIEENCIELDRTAFYPGGGGQANDVGEINSVEVIEAKKMNDTIYHVVESILPFSVGIEVKCELDWERRYSIMKLHSAAHIMEYFLWNRLGNLERSGSYVDENKDRSDYFYEGRLPTEDLKKIEEKTNSFLLEAHDIIIMTEPEYPEIRIWKCSGIEVKCAGTHVRNTKEIGRIKLKRRNPGKGKERIETTLQDVN
jgi:alanyl-tRNA synthetase